MDIATSHAMDFKRAAMATMTTVHVDEARQEVVDGASVVMDHKCSATMSPMAENAVTLFRKTCKVSSRKTG